MLNAEPSIVLAILLFRATDRQAKRARPYIVDLYFDHNSVRGLCTNRLVRHLAWETNMLLLRRPNLLAESFQLLTNMEKTRQRQVNLYRASQEAHRLLRLLQKLCVQLRFLSASQELYERSLRRQHWNQASSSHNHRHAVGRLNAHLVAGIADAYNHLLQQTKLLFSFVVNRLRIGLRPGRHDQC